MPEDVRKIAIETFANGHNCAQSVLRALAGELGLDDALAVRLATGFGVGMVEGGTCGAVSGAVMALGLAGGGGGPDGHAAKSATYERVRTLYARFAALHGTHVCRELLGLDPSTPEGLEQARREKRFQSICSGLVGDAAALAQTIIATVPAADLP